MSDERVCDLCFEPASAGCGCAEWQAYWDSLTPEGKRAELQMMADYENEEDRRDDTR